MSMYSGFAQGLRAGGGLVSSALENERADAAEARAAEDYKDKVATRERMNQAWGGVGKYGTEGPASSTAIPEDYQTPQERGLGTTSPVTAAAPSAPAAPSAAGPADTTAAPAPTAAVAVAGTPGAALGNAPATAPSAAAPAAAPAPPKISEGMQQARQMYNVAVASRDMNAVTTARNNLEAVDQREIAGTIGKMTPDEVSAYVQKNVNTTGGLPLAVTELGPGKYRLTTWGKDGVGRESMLNGAQAQQLALSHALMEKYPDKGMALAASINKDLDATVKEYNTETKDQNTQANTAVHSFAQDQASASQAATARGRLGLEQQKFEQEKWKPIGPSDDNKGLLMIDPQGNTKVNPLPEGSDASKVWNKISGAKSGGRTGPDKEVPGEGSIQKRSDGTTYKADGRGGEMHLEGIVPTQRESTLSKAGFSKDEIASLPFNDDGIHVEYNGQGYSVHNKSDMKQLRTDMDWAEHNRIKSAEETQQINTAVPRAEQQNTMRSRIGRDQPLGLFPDPTQPQRPNW